ncbi:MAG: glycogen-binding domain-containing protein [Gemmatimonadaceae bacterium]|nr:glycogen-binding domain-containing protein [Gemmatimonadaceae bacterium]
MSARDRAVMLPLLIMPLLMLSLPCSADMVLQAQPALQVHVNSGTATDQRGLRSGAVSVVPVLTLHESSRQALSLFASGTQFAQSARAWTGGGVARWRSPSRGPASLSFMADAAYTGTTFEARFLQAQTSPALDWQQGPLTVSAGVRGAYGRTTVRLAGSPPPGGGLGDLLRASRPTTTGTQQTESRALWGPHGQVSVDLLNGGRRSSALHLALGYGAWQHSSETVEPAASSRLDDVSLNAALVFGALRLQGAAGRRFQGGQRSDFGSAQLAVALSPVFTLTAGGGSYLADPVSGALGGRFLTAGVSVKVGGAASGRMTTATGRAAPAVRGVSPPPPGSTRLVLRAPRAQRVALAGDWNAWRRQPAQRGPDGLWYVDVQLAPGEYRYAFLVDDAHWRVPDHAVTSDDGFGGTVAWISVRNSAR